jgi:hypothetical protein
MTSLLHRRLARIEAALKVPPEQGFTILLEPSFEAHGAEWQAHRQAINTAWLRGDRVGVVRSPDSADHDQPEAGIEYFENELHAWLAVLASQKSQQGRANRLADVLASLSGTTLGVVTDPIESEEAA